MFQEIKVAQAAGVDPTSTPKLKARICAASRLLGFSTLSRLIFGIQGGNICCPNFTLMLLNNWASKHCHRCLMGWGFFPFFFVGWCWKWLMRCFSEGRKLHWDMIRASRVTLRFYSAVWKGCRVPHRVPSCCWERTGNCLLNLLLSIDYLCWEEGEALVFDAGSNVITISKQENVLTCWWGC